MEIHQRSKVIANIQLFFELDNKIAEFVKIVRFFCLDLCLENELIVKILGNEITFQEESQSCSEMSKLF